MTTSRVQQFMLPVLATVLSTFTIVYIGVKSGSVHCVSDPRFFFQKFQLILMTVSIGYLIALLSNGDILKGVVLGAGNAMPDYITQVFQSAPYMKDMFCFIGIAWLATAVSLLPVGNTIVDRDSGQIELSSTDRIRSLLFYVYIFPFQIVTAIFSFTLSLYIFKVLRQYMFRHTELKSPDKSTFIHYERVGSGYGFFHEMIDKRE